MNFNLKEHKDVLKARAKDARESMVFVAKEVSFLARRLDKTPLEEEEHLDRFISNLVEASFFTNAFAIASKAFNKMIQDGASEKSVYEYLMDELKPYVSTDKEVVLEEVTNKGEE